MLAHGKAAAASYYGPLIRRRIARGELRPDLDPEIAASVILAVSSEAGAVLTRRLGIDSVAFSEADVRRFDTPAALQDADELIENLPRGRGNPARRR